MLHVWLRCQEMQPGIQGEGGRGGRGGVAAGRLQAQQKHNLIMSVHAINY